jgi:hypothetical protein
MIWYDFAEFFFWFLQMGITSRTVTFIGDFASEISLKSARPCARQDLAALSAFLASFGGGFWQQWGHWC